jgi:hypothetical protein
MLRDILVIKKKKKQGKKPGLGYGSSGKELAMQA